VAPRGVLPFFTPGAAGLPFGDALRDVAVGTPVVNARALAELRLRGVGAMAPSVPVFVDRLDRYELPPGGVAPAEQVAMLPAAERGDFLGFHRAGARGVGTRNYVIIVPTISRAAPFARRLAARFEDLAAASARRPTAAGAGAAATAPGAPRDPFPRVDGVVALAHAEGDDADAPDAHTAMLRRTLAACVLDRPAARVGDSRCELGGVGSRLLTRRPSFPRD